jgi:hypothetical protein
MRYSIENRVGRLVELRMVANVTLEEVQHFRVKVFSVLTRVPTRAVAVVDLMRAEMFSPDVAEALLVILRTDNPKIERSAYIMGARAAFTLQLERMLADAADSAKLQFDRTPPARKVVHSTAEAREWLAPVLDAEELASLDIFLAETAPS